jgi:hypothetical protein
MEDVNMSVLPKNTLILSSLMLLLTLTLFHSVHAEKRWDLRVNGEHVRFESEPKIVSNRLYVPLKDVIDAFNGLIHYDSKQKQINVYTKKFQSLSTRQTDAWGRVLREQYLPTNALDYPYILNKWKNEMYQMKFAKLSDQTFRTPRQLFEQPARMSKRNLDQLMHRVKKHYQLMLNVDYRTIGDPAKWAAELLKYRSQTVNKQYAWKQCKEYADWVKNNQIVIRGTISPEPSMIYYSGFDYYIRAEFTFEIVRFQENKKILFDMAYDWNKLEKGKLYNGYADLAIDTLPVDNWGDTATVSQNASLFFNSNIHQETSK